MRRRPRRLTPPLCTLLTTQEAKKGNQGLEKELATADAKVDIVCKRIEERKNLLESHRSKEEELLKAMNGAVKMKHDLRREFVNMSYQVASEIRCVSNSTVACCFVTLHVVLIFYAIYCVLGSQRRF